MIGDPTLIFRGMKELVCQTFAGLDLAQIHKISPPAERAIGFRRSTAADHIGKRLHDGSSLRCLADLLTPPLALTRVYQNRVKNST
jgi:hypothetical protein